MPLFEFIYNSFYPQILTSWIGKEKYIVYFLAIEFESHCIFTKFFKNKLWTIVAALQSNVVILDFLDLHNYQRNSNSKLNSICHTKDKLPHRPKNQEYLTRS